MSDLHEVHFTWPSIKEKEVIVTGSFDQWSQTIHMTKTPNGFEAVAHVPWSTTVQYKFVADGKWALASDQPTEDEGAGIVNHIYKSPSKPEESAPAQVVDEVKKEEPAPVADSAIPPADHESPAEPPAAPEPEPVPAPTPAPAPAHEEPKEQVTPEPTPSEPTPPAPAEPSTPAAPADAATLVAAALDAAGDESAPAKPEETKSEEPKPVTSPESSAEPPTDAAAAVAAALAAAGPESAPAQPKEDKPTEPVTSQETPSETPASKSVTSTPDSKKINGSLSKSSSHSRTRTFSSGSIRDKLFHRKVSGEEAPPLPTSKPPTPRPKRLSLLGKVKAVILGHHDNHEQAPAKSDA